MNNRRSTWSLGNENPRDNHRGKTVVVLREDFGRKENAWQEVKITNLSERIVCPYNSIKYGIIRDYGSARLYDIGKMAHIASSADGIVIAIACPLVIVQFRVELYWP